jgi:hypothetical protein
MPEQPDNTTNPGPMPEPSQAMVPVVQTADKEYDRFARLGTWLAAAEGSNDPRGRDGMAAAARVAIAVESGWPWRAAFEIALVHNKPHISSALLRALAEAEGYRVLKVDGDETSCTAAVMDRNGHELGRATFTIEQAKRAGLVKDKSAWTTYPERMLWARASGFAVMDSVPHVALGFSALETEDIITLHPADVTEVDDQPAPEAEVST